MRHLIFLVAIVAIPAYSQMADVSVGLSSRSNNARDVTFTVPKDAWFLAVTGAPYSYRIIGQTVRTLANGTHLTQQTFDQPMSYRDSLGRTRESPQPGIAQIMDPVAGYLITLDPVQQIAHRISVQARTNPAPKANAAIRPAQFDAPRLLPGRRREEGVTVQNEKLGAQTIFGVPAFGFRTTTTYPVGTYQGNDQPVTIVHDDWYFVEYGLILKSSDTSPEFDSTMTMKDFSTAEPDPSLFTIPAGYKIVDETEDFTVPVSWRDGQ